MAETHRRLPRTVYTNCFGGWQDVPNGLIRKLHFDFFLLKNKLTNNFIFKVLYNCTKFQKNSSNRSQVIFWKPDRRTRNFSKDITELLRTFIHRARSPFFIATTSGGNE